MKKVSTPSVRIIRNQIYSNALCQWQYHEASCFQHVGYERLYDAEMFRTFEHIQFPLKSVFNLSELTSPGKQRVNRNSTVLYTVVQIINGKLIICDSK